MLKLFRDTPRTVRTPAIPITQVEAEARRVTPARTVRRRDAMNGQTPSPTRGSPTSAPNTPSPLRLGGGKKKKKATKKKATKKRAG